MIINQKDLAALKKVIAAIEDLNSDEARQQSKRPVTTNSILYLAKQFGAKSDLTTQDYKRVLETPLLSMLKIPQDQK